MVSRGWARLRAAKVSLTGWGEGAGKAADAASAAAAARIARIASMPGWPLVAEQGRVAIAAD